MNLQTLTVKTGKNIYPINITMMPDYGSQIKEYIKGKQILIVTNDTVGNIYLKKFKSSLIFAMPDMTIETCILKDGEQYKNQDSINIIYDILLENHFSRDVTLIALGGGVIGDMTGFVAASYMRGVNFIQVPTTLLSQVDSSVGGKTGINHPLGKNMIGAFWQPEIVLADLNTLKTLPERELSAGMAEVIKYALIADIAFLDWLEEHMVDLMSLDFEKIAYAVKCCCKIKAQIVEEDERESGIRAILNYGHTFGHVIETYMGYGEWLHGEAVAVGMVQASKLSYNLGWLSKKDVERIEKILLKAKLPILPPKIPIDKSLRLMSHDKKAISGQIRLILLSSLGHAKVTKDFLVDDLIAVL